SEAPANQEEGEEQRAVVSDVGVGGGDAGLREQIVQSGDQDEGVDERVHAVECPPAPGGEEAALLVGGERRLKLGRCHTGILGQRIGHELAPMNLRREMRRFTWGQTHTRDGRGTKLAGGQAEAGAQVYTFREKVRTLANGTYGRVTWFLQS